MSKFQRFIFFFSSSFVLSVVILIRLSLLPQGYYEPDIEKRIAYTKDPALSDQLCIKDVKRAKRDIANGKIVFTHRLGFGTMPYRFETELSLLCTNSGLMFEPELISDFSTGETQGCYADYMDGVIQDRFGREFKQRLLKQADSLFITNAVSGNRLVDSGYCDEKPYLTNEAYRKDEYSFTLRVDDIPIKKDSTSGNWPHLDVGLIIEKNGMVSDYYVSFYSATGPDNLSDKEDLFEKAKTYLKTIHPIWIPGKVANNAVRTDHTVRIFFHGP